MFKSTQLGKVLETCCSHCQSRFRITEKQLQQAYGKTRCGECGVVFNALISLKSYEGKLPPNYVDDSEEHADPLFDSPNPTVNNPDFTPQLSLHEAMYGSERRAFASIMPLIWIIGILLLVATGVAQAFYYQRYQLIESPRYQKQVLNLCRILPCSESQFSSIDQIKMLERNVFTHPVNSNALMVSGSFVNQAPFAQKYPDLLISLFDIKGNLIANRLFDTTQYLHDDRPTKIMAPEVPVQFRLEIADPGSEALTYEFEFF
ncbi:MAG: putative Zn finger-like uncharacterized protein [Planctomycetota bacterium]|jgi:predicted Zn finger-like uncharacterized protein